jgi:hypothetical protein
MPAHYSATRRNGARVPKEFGNLQTFGEMAGAVARPDSRPVGDDDGGRRRAPFSLGMDTFLAGIFD